MVDDDSGEILSNKGGLLLDKILQSVLGMKRSQVYASYVLKCRVITHTSSTPAPTTEQIDTCQAYLLSELKLIRPQIIIALGAKGI